MRVLLLFVTALCAAQTFDPAPFPDSLRRCEHQDFRPCFDGCWKTQCGGIGAVVIGWDMYKPGGVYSSCGATGSQCTDPAGGHACQRYTITVSYTDCNDITDFLTMAPCCEAGDAFMAANGRDPIVIWPDLPLRCAVEDRLLPMPVRIPKEQA